jgi:hypothetical protein
VLHPSTTLGRDSLETLHLAAVAILAATLFDAHNAPAAAGLEQALRGTDTQQQLIMQNPHYLPFAGKCSEDGPTAWY